MDRRVLAAVVSAALAVSCGTAQAVPPPRLFPNVEAWRVPLPAAVRGPLAHDAARLFVATADGGIRALTRQDGRLAWGSQGRSGVLTAVAGGLAVRGEAGTVWLLDGATGRPQWTADAGVPGALPVVASPDRWIVAGDGLVALDPANGSVQWRAEDAPRQTAEPALVADTLLTGEAGGLLRARDPATGAVRWTFTMASDLVAPPVVDEDGRVLVGTTDGRFVAVRLRDGKLDWRWKVGADVRSPAHVFGRIVLFASHEAVLYATHRSGGNLAWRTSLPSRPLSGPIGADGAVLVAVAEDEVVGVESATGKVLGRLRAPAEISVPPLLADGSLFLGLREPSVMAVLLGVAPATPPPTPEPAPSAPEASPTPTAPASPAASPTSPPPSPPAR